MEPPPVVSGSTAIGGPRRGRPDHRSHPGGGDRAMREATIHIVDGRAEDIHFDGKEGIGIDSFLLITHRRNVEEGHFLAFGSSDRVGKMLFNFYLNCLRNDCRGLGETLEQVAQDILDVARSARGRQCLPERVREERVN